MAYIFISFAISIIGCRKQPMGKKELPSITQEGKNTFGCRVNGILWVPFSRCPSFFGGNHYALSVAFVSAVPPSVLPIGIGLDATKEINSSSSHFQIRTNYLVPPFTFITSVGNIYDSLDIRYWDDAKGSYDFRKIVGGQGVFEISKLDTVNKIISGIFNFTLSNGTDSVVITEGRFDFRLEGYCHCDL